MLPLVQLAVLVVTAAGSGFWFWWLAGRPAPWRRLIWLWCALAGYSLHTLALQALVYADLPLRSTAPWGFVIAVLGVCGSGWRWARSRVRRPRGWLLEAAAIAAGGAAAVFVQTTSMRHIGSDRFVGRGTIDQVNYVLTSQFLVEKPFSMEQPDVGLRPWLAKAIDAKNERLTECVALGATAVASHTDAQRAWGGSTAFFVLLLAIALAGMLRLVGGLPLEWSALGGAWGAAVPAVATVTLIGAYSQLSTLWVFPALVAICRPGALPRRAQLCGAVGILGFLFGAYTEFFPVGASLAALLLLSSRGSLPERLLNVLLVAGGAIAVTTAYVPRCIAFLLHQAGRADNPAFLQGWAADAGTWRGWADYFFAANRLSVMLAAVLLAMAIWANVAAGAQRRRWLWAGLAGPVLLFVYLNVSPHLPVYAVKKMGLGFAPVCVGIATIGLWAIIRRFDRRWHDLGAIGLVLAFALSGSAAWAVHQQLATETRTLHRADYDKLWAARARAETHPERTYLIAEGNGYIGAWLAYFARNSNVYYDLESLSDRRMPTSAYAFRRVPAEAVNSLWWLDLNREGAVQTWEPSPRFVFDSPAQVGPGGAAYLLGERTAVVFVRAAGYPPALREWVIEMGIQPLPAAGECRVEFVDLRTGKGQVLDLRSPTLAKFPIVATAGENRYELRVTPRHAPASAGDPLIVVQSLSLESRGEAYRPETIRGPEGR